MKNGFFLLLFSLFTLFVNCSRENSKGDELFKITNTTIISTERLLPNSYQFSCVPRLYKNHWYYLDKSVGAVIKLDEKFNFTKSVQIIGPAPTQLKKVFGGISIAGDFLFIFGNYRLLVYDLAREELVGVFKDPFQLGQQIISLDNEFLIGHVLESKEYVISKFRVNADKGIVDIENVASINFPKDVVITEKSGWLAHINDRIIFIQDCFGEAYSFDDKTFALEKKIQLPYSGSPALNISYEDGTRLSNFFQAYSVAIAPNNQLAVMREIDFEKSNFVDLTNLSEEVVRKKIHFLDEDLTLRGSLKVNYFSTEIAFGESSLITLNYEDEVVIRYELDRL